MSHSLPKEKEQGYGSDILFFLFFAFSFCVIGIGRGSLASWDEAYYGIVSKGIYQSGDWVHLKYFKADFYDKPPLYFWVTTIFYRIFGVGELATRLFSALAGIGVILTTYGVGRRFFGRAAGVAGAGILLSSTDFLHYARWGTLDITHLFFFTAAIFFFLKAKDRPVFWILFWVCCAAAVMTKGPLIILAWVLLFFHSFLYRDFRFLKQKEFWLGLMLGIALVLPWHLAAYLHNPISFTKDFLYKHYISRTSSAVEGHTGNYYFYIRTLINKYHPWIILAIGALPWCFWKASKSSNRKDYIFLLFWVALVLGFFTFLVKTKLQWYILLLHPALSILIGLFLVSFILRKQTLLWVKLVVAVSLFLHVPFSSVLIHDYTPAIKSLAGDVKKMTDPKDRVYLYDYHEEPAAVFYFERPVLYTDSLDELDKQIKTEAFMMMLVPSRKYEDLRSDFAKRGFSVRTYTSGLKEDLVLIVRS